MTTKCKTKTAPKVAPAKVTPLKSQRMDDRLRHDIVHLATRNLLVEEIKAAESDYHTAWWALFRTANEHALNLWCCLPADWQEHGHYQSRSHTLCAYNSAKEYQSHDATLDNLSKYVKLPANFHAFPHSSATHLCATDLKAAMVKADPKRGYKGVSNKALATILEASRKAIELRHSRDTTVWELSKLLREVSSTKQLLEVWPEGERFIPHPPAPVAKALSVSVANITAALKAGGAM